MNIIKKYRWELIVLLSIIFIFFWYMVRPSYIKTICYKDAEYWSNIGDQNPEIWFQYHYNRCLISHGL